MDIPDTIDAGEYEITLFRKNRSVIIPEKVVINYGNPAIRVQDYFSKSAYKDKAYAISYKGYNLVSGHSYEMVLTNDLYGTRKIPLTPGSHLELSTNLPADIAQGTHKIDLYIDGFQVKYTNALNGVNFVYVRENADQPVITLLSQRSNAYSGPAGKTYRPATRFNRSEEIILFGDSKPPILKNLGQTSRLILKRTDGRETYELPLSDSTASALMTYFPQFRITDDVLPGRYEARLSVQEKDETEPRVSGPYYQIITIEQ